MQLLNGLVKLSKFLTKKEKINLYLLLLKGAKKSGDKIIQSHILEASNESISA